ncbi:type II CRISPR RNA-guided endonuclease Cas9 [Macrococcoides caseolyticum]|uniref:type II CRISPR RNA-guided endonuclease Cas9 n=1 Tax=Macrococcoides caseolyticum TaxID=69966 RepID=UPI000C31D7AA|nr:type II CRISPR RNA-guided endonuclease Cas9 [Macrococcus caseolyticus]PKE19367.1 type II CRISPR RNA-guided endonuclease Cas9 [Macrococcus caseolyticus]PKF40878.1 type II CRISPR RNA-guided endonuclease Cas9 [Macrococcus caseolyticus]QYA35073.1 type II CRISPR RNA-guided endonuclease Cas9 [Macrococcus caseolyticus]
MDKSIKPYILSLDIGTASVGYSAMDKNFNILKYHDKDAIGVLTFESASTAAERRLQRGARRRYNRRVKRLGLLQEVLAPLVKNPNFYKYENLSKWKNNNHDFQGKSLSEVLRFLGMDGRKYPTIYHLQYALLTEQKKFAPELIYIALYHLVKYRGHFLFDQLDLSKRTGNEGAADLQELIESFESLNEMNLSVDSVKLQEIFEILKDESLTRNDRSKQLNKIQKPLSDMFKMLLGMKFKEFELFPRMDNYESLKEDKKSYALSEDYEASMSEKLTQEQREFIELGNKVYMSLVLESILQDASCVSHSKVNDYDKFKEELKTVKDIIYKKDATKQLYTKIFVSSKDAIRNYDALPSVENYKKLCLFDQYLKHPKTKYDDLKKELKSHIDKSHPFYELLEENKLLRVLNTVDNSSIPMQNNLFEAERTLKNQQSYHKEITNEMIEQVLSIIKFRIPYYVGPLVKQSENQKFGWMTRNSDVRIKPWNFDSVVNRSKSAEKFIRKMTNKCTYLMNEDVLPKNSLIYQEMEVLNELNGVQVRPENAPKHKKYRLEPIVKQYIYNEIFKKSKSVTHKSLMDKMKKSEHKMLFTSFDDKLKVFGTQDETKFVSKLSTYQDMNRIIGNVEDNYEKIEEIVLWITIFEDKNILEDKIKEKYPDLSKKQIEQLKKLNYSGWGRISEKLLTHDYNGFTVIDLLRRTDQNFMEIITSKDYGFKEFISNENQIEHHQVRYKDVAALATSPALKKGIWNTLEIVRELTSIFGEPEYIVMEFATEDGEKGKRQKSRKQQWESNVKVYKLKSVDDYKKVIEESSYENFDFQNDKLWLYLSQNGKCMYTHESIDLGRLLNDKSNQVYEIDHIYPQRLVKDDSINNKVLVVKSANQHKSGDAMPLEKMSETKRGYMISFWKRLNDNGLISSTKLTRLMKPTLSELDKEGFIQRQLVETRQISSHVRDFLEEEYANSKVIPMKSRFASEFRKRFEIPKIRELNDSHHAIDAYLNGVVYLAGRVIYPDVDFFDFNFKREKVRQKWKAMGENLNENRRRNDFFFFRNIENLDLSEGEMLTSKIKMDIDHFKINYVRKTGGQESAFYKQTAYSPKLNQAKYDSDKNDFVVYKEMKVLKSHAIYYVEVGKNGKPKDKYSVVDELVIESYQNKDLSKDELAMYLAKRESKFEVTEAKYLFEINKGDIIYLNNHPTYFVSSGEVINGRQFRMTIEEQINLRETLRGKINQSKEELNVVYQSVAQKLIEDYAIILPKKDKESKIEKIMKYFETTEMTLEDLEKCIKEVFKVAGANAGRSDYLGGRMSGLSDTTFFGKDTNAKIQFKSITGLKSTKPKSLYKLAESLK